MKGESVGDFQRCRKMLGRNGDFLVSVWNRRREILCGNGSICEDSRNNPTPECKVSGNESYES